MKPLLKVLNNNKARTPPCWLMRQAGRYLPEYLELRSKNNNFLNFCLSPHLAAQATLQPLQRYNLDAAIIFSDILVIPYALGQKIEFIENKGPILEPLSQPEHLARLDWKGIERVTSHVCEAIDLVKAQLSPTTTLIGFAGASWTLACYMIEGHSSRDFNQAKAFAFRWPKAFQILLNQLAEITADYLIAQVNAGAEVLQLFDSWAGCVPSSHFYPWVIEPTRKIVQRVKESYPDVPIIGFPRRCGAWYKEFLMLTGVTALSLDDTLNLIWARQELGKQAVLQGALNPMMLVFGGLALRHEVERQLKILNTGPYIFNLGHGILPETPPAHVQNLIELIKNLTQNEEL
ncbi:MAG: uroporphyrinogen decarboxylase [Alphaproteobacteria bacterium]|nr:uroporphyrinogen decarboxylase [Alphaproteobacteria bacterium]